MMQCHTDDVIGQIYDATDPWPDTHIWLLYLPWTHKRQKNCYNRKLCDLKYMWGYPRSLTSSDLMELNDSVETQL